MSAVPIPWIIGLSVALSAAVQAATNSLPASAALPVGSASGSGFVVRVLQGPETPPLANNSIRALRQLNGTLTDSVGVLIPNEAQPSAEPDGLYRPAVISFEREGTFVDLLDGDLNLVASFFPDFFPGIPGTGGHTDNFVTEAVAFLELPAGVTTFGISVGADRTDVNNDDGYQVFVAANPRDVFGLKVGEYERSFVQPFASNQRSYNLWSVDAPVAGVYPIRIVHWQTGLGANLNFFSVVAETGEFVIVNDPADARSIKAFQTTAAATATGPYLAEIGPSPGSEGNSAAAPITALLVDGSATVATTGVRLFLNEVQVTPQTLTKTGNRITLQYNPNVARTEANNVVRLEFTDSVGTSRTNTWSFGIITSGGSATQVAGQWDFNAGDLSATVGAALTYLDGLAGLTQQGTRFGTTTALGISDIGGEPAAVMEVPGDLDRNIGYVMAHGIAPNGGGTRVNQYTLIMDVFVEESGPGAASLWQTSSANNTDDGDLFWQGNNFGQGAGGYNGRGTFTAGAWHRVVAAYDMAATPPVVTKYVDGIKQDDWTAGQGLDNTRRALAETAILFADGDQDERRKMWVNSIQIRSGKLSDAEAFVLGGPTAAGIPQSIPQSNVTGMWDFAFNDLGAAIGTPLSYLDGAEGLTQAGTQFGLAGEGDLTAVPPIGEQPTSVMRVPPDLDRNIGYVMAHRIAPNGGGTLVNQYTLIMDVFVAESGPGAASLWQVSSANNTDDGDLFWQGNNFGQGGGGYNGRGTFTAGAWHRVVAAYDMAANPPLVAKFVDGIKQDDWTTGQGLDNPRRALQPTAILFADGDQDERREMFVSAVQIRSGRISDAQAVLLGGPSAAGIPVVLPESNVTGQWDFEFGDLGATVGTPLAYLDGAEGLTQAGTAFGITGEGDFAAIPLIGEQPASVMKVPGDLDRNIGYIMAHRIPPNGGGTLVNRYTLILDILVADTGPGAASLWQTSSLNNTDDGDLFWQGGNFGQGAGGYEGTGAFTAGEWHRVVASYDMAATPPVVVKYVDGIFQDNWTTGQSLDNPRRALQSTAILFGDGDQDERREMYVSSIQIRSAPLSPAEMEELGGPTASGIPLLIAAVAPPPAPVLSIVESDGSVTISWPTDVTGYTLETTSALTTGAVWTPVAGVANNSVTLTPGAGPAFYRLQN